MGQFDSITQMTFFNKVIFGDMLRKEKCILIPLNKHTKIRKASKSHGKYAFLISDTDGGRKWYITLSSLRILREWMTLLSSKYRILSKQKRQKKKARAKSKSRSPKKSIDLQIESSFSSISGKKTSQDISTAIDTLKCHLLSHTYSESMNHLTIFLTNDRRI